jgi:UPF0755 protein
MEPADPNFPGGSSFLRKLGYGFLGFVVLLFIGMWLILWAPNTFDGDRFIHVSKGENFRQVEDSLEHAGIIRSTFLFKIAGKLTGWTTRMQIGKYRFRSGMSNLEILNDIRTGSTIEMIQVSIAEGLRASRQASILSRRIGIDSARFMALVHDTAFVRSLGIDAPSLEGYLMPMTYRFYWQANEDDIIRMFVTEFNKVYTDTLRKRAQKLGLTVNEVLTMASIIENETAVDTERAMIAGVYYNRLKKNMRLQADPTVQYALQEHPHRLHYSDLATESAYNTYRHEGLPPGPINNPGKQSIIAALYPDKHRFLFFVANGIGGHTFTKTYNDHLRAVQKYRRVREEQRAAKENG